MIYLGADHGGYKYKEQIKNYLAGRGYQVADLGTDSEEPYDYPLIAREVAAKVIEDPNNRGVLICRGSAGVCIAANKVKGVLAASAWNQDVARAARNDDDINVLCVAADYTDYQEVEKMVQTFLDTSFDGQERRKRRVEQIREIEKEN